MQSFVSNQQAQQHVPRVLFFGMQGTFSTLALKALLEHNLEVAALVVPATALPGRETLAIQRREAPRTLRTNLPLDRTNSYTPAWPAMAASK